MPGSFAPLLQVQQLTTLFDVGGRAFRAVDDVSFTVRDAETLGLVGESGSGKSLTALSILRMVPRPGRIAAGKLRFRGRDLLALSESEMRGVRGAEIALVPQEPSAALNPVFTVGDQIAEVLIVHGRASRREARRRAVEWIERVRVPGAARRASSYPHELSGGQLQRILIASAIACGPSLLIADEPTTSLDVTIQAQVLDLLDEMRAEFGLSMLLISHDLGVIARHADRVAVMYAGRIVEQAPVREIFRAPRHPYTAGLLASIPKGDDGGRLRAIAGSVPGPSDPVPGCAFAPRCAEALPECLLRVPPSIDAGPDHTVNCLLPGLRPGREC